METKPLTHELTVSGQITVEDVTELSNAGVKSIICNRPDQEEAQQPSFETIEDAAKVLGIEFVYQPVISGQMTQQNVDDFANAIKSLPTPIHAYCRSGMRCTSLWGLSLKQAGADSQHIVKTATDAGYDITKLIL